MKKLFSFVPILFLGSYVFAGTHVQQGDSVTFSSVTIGSSGIKFNDGTTQTTAGGGGGSGSGTVSNGTASNAAFYAASTTTVSSTGTLVFVGGKVGISTAAPVSQLSVGGSPNYVSSTSYVSLGGLVTGHNAYGIGPSWIGFGEGSNTADILNVTNDQGNSQFRINYAGVILGAGYSGAGADNSYQGGYELTQGHLSGTLSYGNFSIINQGGTEAGVELQAGTGGKIKLSPASGQYVEINSNQFVVDVSSTPGSSSSVCTTGTFEYDASYIYVCTGTNTWKRATLGTF